MDKLLIISGPTATGKTGLAVRLARTFGGELVNADSRQVYKGLSILSGKDIPAGASPVLRDSFLHGETVYPLVTYDIGGVPVWMLDVADLSEQFSVSHYAKGAGRVLLGILNRGKLPILVGGTGLYIRSVIGKIDTIDIPPDPGIRKRWSTLNVDRMQEALRSEFPERFEQMNNSDRYNPRRLVRAYEIARQQGINKPRVKQPSGYDIWWVGLRPAPDQLPGRIAGRVEARIRQGVIDEVNAVSQNNAPVVRMTGLVPICRYIQGKINMDQMKSDWIREEVQYAKRQMTWFGAYPDIRWYDADRTDVQAVVEKSVSGWYT